MTMFRLRQVALVAQDLEPTVSALCDTLGLSVCYRDPGVAEFGLHNALMVIGDQFLEVVSPMQDGTTAGRLLDKRGGDGGYMAIYETDDLDSRMDRLADSAVRIVWAGDFSTIRGRHLHPRDVGGAIVSIDQPVPNGSWAWAGPNWTAHQDTSVVTSIAGITVSADDPEAMGRRWAELGLRTAVEFVEADGRGADGRGADGRGADGRGADGRGEGIDGVDLVATDRSRAGESYALCGVTFRLV